MDAETHLAGTAEILVPLFPLPNVVLFPRAAIPLHIFEPRYREMTADALLGRRQIAMALLKPGWEKDYYQAPAVEPVVCVGRIVNSEMLPDGNYNLLLQGELRAVISGENRERAYRVARVRPLEQKAALEEELAEFRRRMREIVSAPELAEGVMGRHLRKIVLSPLGTSEIADLLAFNFLEEAGEKQSLLAEPDELRRVARVVEAIEARLPTFRAGGDRSGPDIGLN